MTRKGKNSQEATNKKTQQTTRSQLPTGKNPGGHEKTKANLNTRNTGGREHLK